MAQPPRPSVSPIPAQDKEKNGASEVQAAQPNSTIVAPSGQQTAPLQQPNLETHYTELLKLIGEIGRDVKPAYTNNKISTDRLRKNIMIARGVVRECLSDLDRLYGNLNGQSYR